MIISKIYRLIDLLQLYIGNLNYIQAYLWEIKIGSGVKFYGRINFLKSKKSQIIIGNNCTFRSSKTSNWIGIDRPCMISTQEGNNVIIRIGNNSGFSGTVIGAFIGITIGDNVRCGANTLITDSDWHLDDPRVGEPKPVFINDNVWLGVNSVVLKGVTIGKNTVIGANSVVVSDIPENVIAAGNPCKVIRQLKD